jgi:archaellum component FlaC
MDENDFKRLLNESAAETRRLLEETSAETHRRIDANAADTQQRFAEMETRFDQVDARFEQVDARFDQVDERAAGLRQHIDKIAEQMKLEFGIAVEDMRTQVQLVAESVLMVDAKLDREAADIRAEMRQGFADTQAMLRHSHNDLDRRVAVLERAAK